MFQRRQSDASRCTSLIIAGDVVIFASQEGNEGWLRQYDIKSGKELANIQLPAPVIVHGLAVAEGQLYASLQNGSVACFAP